MRPLHYGFSPDREIKRALIAAVEAAFARRDPLAQSADGAARTLRPQTAFKIHPRRLRVGEYLEKLESGDSRFTHGSIISRVRIFALVRIAGDARLSTVFAARAIVQNEHANPRVVGIAWIRTCDRPPLLVVFQLPLKPQARVSLAFSLAELIVPVWSVAHSDSST